MRLTPYQLALRAGHAGPRKTVKHCGTCGGEHAGRCFLVATSHGTRVRPDILETVERRFRERSAR